MGILQRYATRVFSCAIALGLGPALGADPEWPGFRGPNANPVAAFRFAQSYYPVPAVYQWSASVQHRLASSWVAELDYVGSHTIHQFQFVDDNAPALPQGDLASAKSAYESALKLSPDHPAVLWNLAEVAEHLFPDEIFVR